jgi:hypothetical protein
MINQLAELLEDENLQIAQRDDIRAEVLAVRGELDKKKPNFRLLRSALRGVVASLGPAEALATIAAHVADIVQRLC